MTGEELRRQLEVKLDSRDPDEPAETAEARSGSIVSACPAVGPSIASRPPASTRPATRRGAHGSPTSAPTSRGGGPGSPRSPSASAPARSCRGSRAASAGRGCSSESSTPCSGSASSRTGSGARRRWTGRSSAASSSGRTPGRCSCWRCSAPSSGCSPSSS